MANPQEVRGSCPATRTSAVTLLLGRRQEER
jgi:hypothetical protein